MIANIIKNTHIPIPFDDISCYVLYLLSYKCFWGEQCSNIKQFSPLNLETIQCVLID